VGHCLLLKPESNFDFILELYVWLEAYYYTCLGQKMATKIYVRKIDNGKKQQLENGQQINDEGEKSEKVTEPTLCAIQYDTRCRIAER